jgi:hypothetical protein
MEISDLALVKDEKVNIAVPGTRNDSSTKRVLQFTQRYFLWSL